MCGSKSSPPAVTHNHYSEPAPVPKAEESTSDLTDPNQQQKVAAMSTTDTKTTFGSELGS